MSQFLETLRPLPQLDDPYHHLCIKQLCSRDRRYQILEKADYEGRCPALPEHTITNKMVFPGDWEPSASSNQTSATSQPAQRHYGGRGSAEPRGLSKEKYEDMKIKMTNAARRVDEAIRQFLSKWSTERSRLLCWYKLEVPEYRSSARSSRQPLPNYRAKAIFKSRKYAYPLDVESARHARVRKLPALDHSQGLPSESISPQSQPRRALDVYVVLECRFSLLQRVDLMMGYRNESDVLPAIDESRKTLGAVLCTSGSLLGGDRTLENIIIPPPQPTIRHEGIGHVELTVPRPGVLRLMPHPEPLSPTELSVPRAALEDPSSQTETKKPPRRSARNAVKSSANCIRVSTALPVQSRGVPAMSTSGLITSSNRTHVAKRKSKELMSSANKVVLPPDFAQLLLTSFQRRKY
jgi:hypothetical protein